MTSRSFLSLPLFHVYRVLIKTHLNQPGVFIVIKWSRFVNQQFIMNMEITRIFTIQPRFQATRSCAHQLNKKSIKSSELYNVGKFGKQLCILTSGIKAVSTPASFPCGPPNVGILSPQKSSLSKLQSCHQNFSCSLGPNEHF